MTTKQSAVIKHGIFVSLRFDQWLLNYKSCVGGNKWENLFVSGDVPVADWLELV